MTSEGNEDQRGPRENVKEIRDNTNELVGHASEAMTNVVEKGVVVVEGLGSNFRDAVQGMLHDRKHTVMVRVDDATLDSLNTLVEAGVVSSRSEAGAFLMVEGIKHRKLLFDRIAEKIDTIVQARHELQALLDDGDELGGLPASGETDESPRHD